MNAASARRAHVKPDLVPPHSLFDAWDEVERRVTRATRLAIFTDFDGTLVPIRRRADHVRMPARTRRLLAALVERGHVVGVVSGRAREDVERLVALPGLWYVGDHGFLLRAPGGRAAILASQRQRAEIAAITRELNRELRSVPDIRLEPKGATVAVHYRGASEKSRLVALHAVAAVVERHTHLRVMNGKKVWELLPASDVDKARIVRFILHWERRRAPRARWLAIYIGDDVTDEGVFVGWRGVSVSVGGPRSTGARYYVRSPADVGTFLRRLTLVGSRSTRASSRTPS